jgi:hypothetical protein
MGIVVFYRREITVVVFAAKIVTVKAACPLVTANIIVVHHHNGRGRDYSRSRGHGIGDHTALTRMLALHIILVPTTNQAIATSTLIISAGCPSSETGAGSGAVSKPDHQSLFWTIFAGFFTLSTPVYACLKILRTARFIATISWILHLRRVCWCRLGRIGR